MTSRCGQAFCKPCGKTIHNNIAHIKRHDGGAEHKARLAELKLQPEIDRKALVEFQKKRDQLKTAELRIIMWLLANNLPFSLVSSLILLIKTVASDSAICKRLKCARTKATTVTNTILCEAGTEDVAKDLRKCRFSIIIDETTDIAKKKFLAIVTRYFDTAACSVRDRFLALMELKSSDAPTIHATLVKLLKDLRVPLENLVGFASDNASVMMGCNKGVQALLKKTNEHLFVMGCMCHSFHLCSAAAAKHIPVRVERLARNVYNYFCHSSKRLGELEELQKVYNLKTTKILKTSTTRWLSLQAVVTRILEKWVALQSYFLVCEVEDDHSDIGTIISQGLTEETRAYFQFMEFILEQTNTVNVLFQSERPLVHELLVTTRSFLKTVLSNFVKSTVIKTSPLHELSLNDAEILLDVESVYVGPDAEVTLSSMTNVEIVAFKTCCRKYYVELCQQVMSRVDLTDPVLRAIENINPKNLDRRLLRCISCSQTWLQVERRSNLWTWSVLQQEHVSQELEINAFWGHIFELKNVLQEPVYPDLKAFIGAILSLPHSSACAERIFSRVAIIKTKLRNQLEVPTVNSCMAATGMISGSDAHLWCPSKELLCNFKKR